MMARRFAAVVLGLASVALFSSTTPCAAGNPDESVRPVLEKLLKAVEANDYDAFVADGTAEVKAGLTKQMLEGVSAQMAPRMKKGYDATFLGEMRQQGCRVYLWKLAYKDGGDDTLARLTLKDGKVAGFLLQ